MKRKYTDIFNALLKYMIFEGTIKGEIYKQAKFIFAHRQLCYIFSPTTMYKYISHSLIMFEQ